MGSTNRGLWAHRNPILSHRILVVLGGIVVAVCLPTLGYLGDRHARYVLGASGFVLLVGVILTDLRFVPLLAVPSALVVQRVGGGSGLSVSDFVLFLGTLCALPLVRTREAPELRRLLWILCFYQATTLLTVIDNPYKADLIEWVHEAMLVGGSLVVGWVIGQSNRTRTAVTLYLLFACVMSIWACLYSVSHHFQPANLPFGMQKNYIGDMLSFAVLLAYARPRWFHFRNLKWQRLVIAISLLGILASQSKQAIISCAAGIVFMVVRDRELRRRSKAIIVALLPLVIIAYEIVSREIATNNRFNSVHQRLSWYDDSFQIWHSSPLVGVGLRWWYTARFPAAFQPPNGFLEMLSSTGVIGELGFAVLLIGSLIVLWNSPHDVGTLALAILITRFIQGELDLFWVGAQGSLPWLIVGIALGAMARQQSGSPEQQTSMKHDHLVLLADFGSDRDTVVLS